MQTRSAVWCCSDATEVCYLATTSPQSSPAQRGKTYLPCQRLRQAGQQANCSVLVMAITVLTVGGRNSDDTGKLALPAHYDCLLARVRSHALGG